MDRQVKNTENTKCAGVKRLLKEAKELHLPTELFCAKPLEVLFHKIELL